LKPLIVAPTSLLKNQWCEEFEGVGISRKDIATDIYDAPNKKVCVVTISSIENALREDWKGLMDVVARAGFGIKVVDEAHLHLKGILKFDAICNIKHNWYLSATLGRSDVLEDSILNRALSDAQRFIGNPKYEEYQKQYVNVYFQDIYYYPSNKLCSQHFKYGSKGLIKATYYNMLMDYHHGIPFINNLLYMMKIAKNNMTYDAKVLLLVPLLSIIDKAIEAMNNDPFFSQYTISGVDGSMSLSTRRQAMESDFILSTTLSMGTGVDVKNLGAVINFDQYASPIITEQIFGRLRDRGKETWYYDITDHVRQARMFMTWGVKRRMLIPYYPGSHDQMRQLPDIKS
jgi:superfamily II DNA or RNA helicase